MQILLVSMPWALFNRPSIQLGALKAFLCREDPTLQVRCSHPYLDVALALGPDTYRQLAENSWAGESIYSALLFPEQTDRAANLLRKCPGKNRGDSLQALAHRLEDLCTRWIAAIKTKPPTLVGFSVCFSQLLSSLYCAHRIKEAFPDSVVIFGGSACPPATGKALLTLFPFIDHIICGEGEIPLLELTRYLRGLRDNIPGRVLTRNDGKTPEERLTADGTITDLNTLPVPEYDDYFSELERSSGTFIPQLPIEFSRGCWWNHCSFCNLNLQWHGYRHKSADTMLRELESLRDKYSCLDFTFTDNALPPSESRRFFTRITGCSSDLSFFGEIRTLPAQADYQACATGGLRTVQVGIEALSDSLLRRMCKGTTVMDNIAALKFALSSGMQLEGNLILEFPGSTSNEVAETLHNLELVLPFHPLAAATFFLGLGSPVAARPVDFGIRKILPHPANRNLFPPKILSCLPLLINSYRGGRTRQRELWRPVRDKIKAWRKFHASRPNPCRPALSYRDGGDFLIIRQELPDGQVLRHRLRGLSRHIYLACEEIRPRKELPPRFPSITKGQFDAFLHGLAANRLVYLNDTACLALAVREQWKHS